MTCCFRLAVALDLHLNKPYGPCCPWPHAVMLPSKRARQKTKALVCLRPCPHLLGDCKKKHFFQPPVKKNATANARCEAMRKSEGGDITWHAGQSKAWRNVEIAHFWKWLNSNNTAATRLYHMCRHWSLKLLLNIKWEYRVSEMQENVLPHVKSPARLGKTGTTLIVAPI